MNRVAVLVKFGYGIGDYTEEFDIEKSVKVPPRLGDFMVVSGYAEEGYSVESPMYRPDGSEIYPHFIGKESFQFVVNVEDTK